jgi:hypothetical protein
MLDSEPYGVRPVPAPAILSDTPIPDTSAIRNRLAEVVTEAALLRAQLRVSKRLERERERLRQIGQPTQSMGGTNAS